MSANENRAKEIRKTVFGIDMRKPVADGIENTANYPGAVLERKNKVGEKMLLQTETEQTEMLNDEKRKDSVELSASKAEEDLRLLQISIDCGYSVKTCSLTPISGEPDCYTLVLTRENGT